MLEPACGTGRYLAGLGARGYDCLGYDVNARALAFARRRGCRVARGELARFRPTGTFDCVLCLVGTFRHLLSDAAARAHLANTAQALAPGGLYVVGLDLCDYRSPRGDDEVWHVARGRREALHAMTTTAPDARRRAERVHNFIAWRDGRREGTLESTYVLRSYDWPQWESVIAGSGFTLAGWYSQDGARQRRRRPGYWLFALQRN